MDHQTKREVLESYREWLIQFKGVVSAQRPNWADVIGKLDKRLEKIEKRISEFN